MLWRALRKCSCKTPFPQYWQRLLLKTVTKYFQFPDNWNCQWLSSIERKKKVCPPLIPFQGSNMMQWRLDLLMYSWYKSEICCILNYCTFWHPFWDRTDHHDVAFNMLWVPCQVIQVSKTDFFVQIYPRKEEISSFMCTIEVW